MNFAATAGPPPNARFHTPDGGRPAIIKNGFVGDMGNQSNKALKSLDEILAARPKIDINSPIRTILSEGDQHAKQAASLLDFRRPDLALEEYLKASIIAVEIIPRHKDYPTIHFERGELHRHYYMLKKRISAQQDRFDEVKKIIKENNLQNGTRPATQSNHTNPANGDGAQTPFFVPAGDIRRTSSQLSLLQENGLDNSKTGADPASSAFQGESNKHIINGKRPAVHPKPEALQGRSIGPKSLPNSVEDLTSRFTRLGGSATGQKTEGLQSKPAQVQDPRIKTRPIVVPSNPGPSVSVSTNKKPTQSHSRTGSFSSKSNRPLGPREFPVAPSKPLKIALGVEIPPMPRQPEAVYSPARNLDSNSRDELFTENPPTYSSTVTRMSPLDSKKDSGRSFMSVDDVNPYFLGSPISMQTSTKRPRLPDLSSLKNITAQQLREFMQIGSHDLSILLVDVRNREDFDSGHIMWHSIICIEPITLRTDVSADNIEQSLVISPDTEQKLYMQRHTFSLVVYYDQSSGSSSKSGNEVILQDFHRAIYDYAYEKRLRNRPLLLDGGLDAWTDLVGDRALASSKSVFPASTVGVQNPQTFARASGLPGTRKGMIHDSSIGQISQSRGNQANEGRDQSIGGPRIEGQDFLDDSYFKNAEDFMRRYPAISEIKESMVSPSNRSILASGPPKRPEKAVTFGEHPHVFSRLTSKNPATDYSHIWGQGRTGLYNRDNLCYMNSAIQALSSIYELRDYLFRGNWLKESPSQKGLLVDQQLATKTFSNLLMHLWSKEAVSYQHVNPRTFVATIKRLHLHALGPEPGELYGGPQQHDSSEFIDFLLEKLCKETTNGDGSTQPWTTADEKWVEQAPLADAANRATQLLIPQGQSPIDAMISHMFVKLLRCNDCHKNMRVFDRTFTRITLLNFPKDVQDEATITLNDLLHQGRDENPLQGFKCKHCSLTNVHQLDILYVRPPPILVMRLLRAKHTREPVLDKGKLQYDNRTGEVLKAMTMSKIRAPVAFPEELDMSRYQVDGTSANYDCFAVVCHKGADLRAGHNISYRRDLAKEGGRWMYQEWWQYNDTQTNRCSFGDIAQEEAYVLFYRLRASHFR